MTTPTDRPPAGDAPDERRVISRVQTGVRVEKRILLVLKALAAWYGISLGDLLEGVVLHAFEGAAPFGPESREKIKALREVYGLDLDARDSHLLVERGASSRSRGGQGPATGKPARRSRAATRKRRGS